VLSIRGLTVTYPGPPPVQAVDAVTLDVEGGECVGILGESGSGKSTLAQSLLGLLPQARVEGSIRLGEVELIGLDERAWQAIRWRRVALAFQSPTALNPVLRVGDQVAEPLEVHLGMKGEAAAARVEELLESVTLGAWAAERYPRELSGGQRRLVLIAMALACDPDVLVLDEPTAGLDPVTRSRVLALLRSVVAARRQALLMVTHDPDALVDIADRVAVMYRGWVAEIGPAARVVANPWHPYSVGLLNSRPTLATVKELRGIRGEPPRPTEVAPGCPFEARCTQANGSCASGRPVHVVPAGEDGTRTVACTRGGRLSVLSARALRKVYESPSGIFGHRSFAAVDDVAIDVHEGEVVGVVGPTGSGKSTLAKVIVRLLEADGGTVRFEGHDLLAVGGKELRAIRRRLQLLFQDPYEALSPRMTVGDAVREPLDVQRIGSDAERDALVRDTLEAVRLPASGGFLGRHAHELSGGQLQRVALARALVLGPKLLVADEPVAMLDASEQAKMLQLLKTLQVERGMAMVFVSHELAVVLRVADRVIVLDEGRVVEDGTGSRLLAAPQHPTTRALLAASGRDELFGPAGFADDRLPADLDGLRAETVIAPALASPHAARAR
jgi:peptide/nickel transport system ATP-binding protein